MADRFSRINPSKAFSSKKATGGSDGILSKLFTDILHTLSGSNKSSINTRFNYFMELFLSDLRNGIPQNTRDKSGARGNLRKELFKKDMSWKVFCKGLRVFNIRRFEITLKLYHCNHRTTFHTLPVDLGEPIYAPGTILNNPGLNVVNNQEVSDEQTEI